MTFYLNCWVPSLGHDVYVSELTMAQFEVLAKYLINDDNDGAEECFNNIIRENLKDADIFSKLNRVDKWFILTYLKCISVSPSILIKAKDVNDNDVTVDLSIVDILTKISEFKYKFDDTLSIKDFKFKFKIPQSLQSKNTVEDALEFFYMADQEINFSQLDTGTRGAFFNNLDNTLKQLLQSFLALQDQQNECFLIENKHNLKNIFNVRFSIFDNTLFAFLKSIYHPYAKSIYIKKYTMINKVGVTLEEIKALTPFELDIYLNILNAENKALTDKKESL